MGKKIHRRRDDSGSMLATVIVIVLGAALCSFLCVLADVEQNELLLGTILGGAAFSIAWIVWYRYGRTNESSLTFWFLASKNRRDDGLNDYVPEKIPGRGPQRPMGSNKPITAEEAREIQVTSSRTWVPAKGGRTEK